jgi:acetoacetyl-CoA synthetase
VSDTSASSRTQVLAQMWQRLLQVPSIGLDDNFFDLGGDSALAVQLFSEIAETFGQQFPPVLIYHVPTIASLAILLEKRTTPELSPLILLKDGSQGSPVFIASGLGGGPAEFFQLVKYVRAPNPMYGLQPKGIEGFDPPCERIEEMADFYLNAVRRFQPHGPYTLIGYSLGGLVTLEMARQLNSMGEKVALVMLDSYPDIKALSRGQFLRLLLQRTRRLLTNLGQPPRSDLRLGGLPSQDAISTFAPAFERVRAAAYQALRQYKPTFYPGSVKFIRAAEVTDFPDDPKSVWAHRIQTLDVETVPGDHLGMLTTHYEKLASVLDSYLEAAASSE